MYIRQLAWLAAYPVDKEKRLPSRREQIDAAAESAGVMPDYNMPDPGPAAYLLEMLREIGEAVVDGGKLRAITWGDLSAWMQATGMNVSPDELSALRRLSGAYVAQYYRSEDKTCLAPHVNMSNRERVAENLKSLFGL